MSPISFGGDDIADVTIDGTNVQEITMDGDVVWQRDTGGGGDPSPSVTIIDDFESYDDTDDFQDAWAVPGEYWSLAEASAMEGSNYIISDGGSYADGTYPHFTTEDGFEYTALLKHGSSSDNPALMVHMQEERNVFDGIRLEVDARDNHCVIFVYDDGSNLVQDTESVTIDDDKVHWVKLEVTASTITATVEQSTDDWSSSWSFADATWTQITSFSTSNPAPFSSGMIGFYGGRGSDTRWDRFAEGPTS